MATPLRLRRDINGNQTYGLSFSEDSYWAQIPAATEATLVVPANVTDAFFSFTKATDVYVRLNGSALTTPPSGATLQLAGDTELNPGTRKVSSGDTLRFYCEDVCEVVVNFYQTSKAAD